MRDLILAVKKYGFTIVEILIVVVIMAIAAAIVIPTFSSGGEMQLRAAANMIAADLEYAKSMAISKGRYYCVVFNSTNESYDLQDKDGVTISHPVKVGTNYTIDFANDSRLDKVDIFSVTFDGTNQVKFDYLGSPYNGSASALNNGVITLKAGQATMTIRVEPVTGYISIN